MPKIIKEGIVFGGGNVVDTTLDTTSTNPVENQAVATAIGQINNDLGTLQFKNNSGTAQYSLDNGSTWKNFSGGAVLIGTYSSNTSIDVSAYGATSADQFLAVCPTNSRVGAEGQRRNIPQGGVVTYYGWFEGGKVSLSGTTLTVTVGRVYVSSLNDGTIHHENSTNIATKVYFVGDIQ